MPDSAPSSGVLSHVGRRLGRALPDDTRTIRYLVAQPDVSHKDLDLCNTFCLPFTMTYLVNEASEVDATGKFTRHTHTHTHTHRRPPIPHPGGFRTAGP